jgi:hypothetical protein
MRRRRCAPRLPNPPARAGLSFSASWPARPASPVPAVREDPHAGVITFHRIGGTTIRVTAQMDIDPEGFTENAADKLGILDRRVKGDMRRFKQFIEPRGGHETGAWRGKVHRPGG